MDIDNMQAGGGIDAEIAEKVMGWKQHSISERMWYGDNRSIGKGGFRPSVDIVWAFEVVEKMRDFEKYLILNNLPESGKYLAVFTKLLTAQDHKIDYFSGACCETAPMAICRAALKAVIDGE